MSAIGHISLRNRVFQVKHASVTRHGGNWCVEVDTEDQEFDGELWAPCLYHQGLRLAAWDGESLQGQTTTWHMSGGPDDPHPEPGIMYVFGHHQVRNCILEFGRLDDGRIEIEWAGECDVFWDDEFSESIPFQCQCSAAVSGVVAPRGDGM